MGAIAPQAPIVGSGTRTNAPPREAEARSRKRVRVPVGPNVCSRTLYRRRRYAMLDVGRSGDMAGVEADVDIGTWRKQIRSRLAASRSELLWQLVGKATEDLESPAPLAALRRAEAQDRTILPPRSEDGARRESAAPPEPTNGSISATLEGCIRARREMLDRLAAIDDVRLQADAQLRNRLDEVVESEMSLARELKDWRDTQPPHAIGPKDVTVAILRAARKELLTAIALIPAEQREMFPARYGSPLLEGLIRTAEADADAIASLGRDGRPAALTGSWNEVWRRLHRDHEELLRLVASPEGEGSIWNQRLPSRDVVGSGRGGYDPAQRTYATVIRVAMTDRDLAGHVRKSLGIRG